MPKIFRLTKGGKFQEAVFEGDTINTVSMLCVEDAVDGLNWAESVGGLKGLIARSEANLKAIADWIPNVKGLELLAEKTETRSCTSICIKITADWFTKLSPDDQAAAAKKYVSLLEGEGVALDIGAYRDAPPGLRIWGGATVDTSDIKALLPWIEWAHGQVAGAA
jgi:phosphoserine aminotransferase